MGQGGGPEALPHEDQMRELGTLVLTRATEVRVYPEVFENLQHRTLHVGPQGRRWVDCESYPAASPQATAVHGPRAASGSRAWLCGQSPGP